MDRQIEILRLLTSADLIFGKVDAVRGRMEPEIRGISISLLKLEAEVSFEKRIGKLRQTFPRLFAVLGSRQASVLREFATVCPPQSYRRYEDARAFYEFLIDRWQAVSPDPPYLADVAKLEMALAKATSFSTPLERQTCCTRHRHGSSLSRIRLAPGAEIVWLDYDIRDVFEGGTVQNKVPLEVRGCVLVTQPQADHRASIAGIPPSLGEILEGLRARALPIELVREIASDALGEGALDRLSAAGALELAP